MRASRGVKLYADNPGGQVKQIIREYWMYNLLYKRDLSSSLLLYISDFISHVSHYFFREFAPEDSVFFQ
jgi:hypothetical protein